MKISEKISLFDEANKVEDLSVLGVYGILEKIAKEEGRGSQDRKVNGLAELIKGLDAKSTKYVARMVAGKLRLGFSDKTLIDALSWMLKQDKSLRDEIEAAYFLKADIGEIAKTIKKNNGAMRELSKIEPELGIPIMPALCQRLKTAQEMIAKMGKVGVEPKYDGVRVQIHLKGKGYLKTFTRNLDETTHMFPELKKAYKQIRAKSVILDCEGVGLNLKTGKLLSFQETIVRKRKYGVEAISKAVPMRFFVFDVLYKDGKSLINVPLYKRRKLLEEIIKKGKVLEIAAQMVTQEANVLRKYHTLQLKKGLEGVVIKKIDDRYVPGRRGWSWVKFKEEEKSAGGLSDTLDCVVMGYYRGKG